MDFIHLYKKKLFLEVFHYISIFFFISDDEMLVLPHFRLPLITDILIFFSTPKYLL